MFQVSSKINLVCITWFVICALFTVENINATEYKATTLNNVVVESLAENNAQRKLFKKAEKELWQADHPRFKSLYNQLHYYSLQPYLDQQILIRHMSLRKTKAIDEFLTKYEATPLDWPLRKKWLTYLAKKNKKALFLKYYKASSDAALTCQQLIYQLAEGLPQHVVFPQVTKLWKVGKSQDKKCDPLFKKWKNAGYQTNDVIWQRMVLAADGGKQTLLPYLTKLLPKNEQYLGNLWLKVRRNPAYIAKLSRFPEKSDREAMIVAYGLKRLIWRNQKLALSTYKKSQQQFRFTQQQNEAITAKFAIALASKNHVKAKEWLAKVADSSLTKNMIQWRLVSLLKEQNWDQLITELIKLPQRYKNALQWKYWYAKALIETNEKERGENLLRQLANERHYYGFLAASYLNLPVNLQDKPIEITQLEKNTILKHSAAKRAFELFYLKRFHQARQEWNYWLESLNNRQKLVAAKIANEAQWFDRAIFTLSKVGYLDDVNLRFPRGFEQSINYHANNQKINPSWAFAIARRESSFMSDANSPVGARGLMQLMPRTAKQLDRKSTAKRYLLDAANNIKLGTKYLRQLLDKNKGNHILATASYNAGPHRVKSWLKDKSPLPADIWIETIPFKETRNYVKSVLAYQQIYQIQVGKETSFFEKVMTMSIPN